MRKKYTIICKYCGKEINPHRRAQIYCSKSCRAKDLGVGHGIKTGKFVKCAECGKEIWRKGSLLKKFPISYCSKECLWKNNGKALIGISREYMTGEKNWCWRGGVTPEVIKIRRSVEGELWRKSVFERDNYTCQICGKVGGRLEADHIKSFALYPELRFDINNGRTLCKSCHIQTDSYGWKGFWLVKNSQNI